MPAVLLILLALVVVFGFGVLIVNRARSRRAGAAAPTRSSASVPQSGTARRDHRSPSAVIESGSTRSPDDRIEADVVPEEAPEVSEAELMEAFESALAAEPDTIATPESATAPVEPIERPRFRDRLTKARTDLAGALGGVRSRGGITQESWDDLEEAMLRADVGVRVTDALLEPLRQQVKAKQIVGADELLEALRRDMKSRLVGAHRELQWVERAGEGPNVWLFVGVNGVGKTTTIGKVAAVQRTQGRRVLLAAGDTFRAAAAEQLQTWAQRSGAEFVRGNEGGDPSAVIFDGVQAAAARHCDLVLGDTAGRLHNKSNLMDELRKVRRVADRDPGRVTEVLLVIDATTGQNGLTQAKEFGEATEVTGVVLTKLDGSAKGGIVFAIETELGLPVKLVGLGESIGDLVPFDPEEFVDALFGD
jgi:fused signal recognition particle receptor